MSNFHNINLDYLRVLNSVLETKSTTKSSQELGVSQSAVSHSLKKLREFFEDELVYRSGGKLALTSKAKALQIPLKKWFDDLNSLVKIEDFDPKTSKTIFTIATTDLVEQLFAPKIIAQLEKIAPNVQLRFVRWHYDQIELGLNNSQYDLAIGVKGFDTSNIYQKVLYKDKLVSMARKKHPIFKGRVTLEKFLAFKHLMTGSGDGRGAIDLYLESLNRKRDLLYIVNSFASAPPIVQNTNCILTGPERLFEYMCENFDVKIFKTPIKTNPIEMKVFWAKHNHDDAKNKWLRNLFYESSK